MASDLPLTGIRVLDCSRVLAGPFATMLLADLGADVVKLEPPTGDDTRAWGPPFWGDPAERRSAYFASVNRNKRSIVVDLQTDAGRSVLDALVRRSDMLVHNARPAPAERLGLDESRLRALNPSLLVARVGGFPSPDADRPAYDLLAQAVSGLMSITGTPDGEPMKVGVALLDLIAGLQLAVGMLAALIGRGRVATVDVSLVEAGVTSLINVLANHLATGADAERHGNAHPNIAPYEAFAARDGHLVIAVGNDAQFARLLSVVGLETDADFATNALRLAHRDQLKSALATAIGARGRDELVAALRDADIPAGPVNSVAEAVASMGADWPIEVGGMRLAPSAIRLDGSRGAVVRPPPLLGEHTAEILAELGLGAGSAVAT